MKIRLFLLISLFSCGAQQQNSTPKINGLCLVAPPYEIKSEYYDPIVAVKANWVAIIPYAFCSPSQPIVKFDHPNQWIGETTDGIRQAITLAQQSGLKIMLKPHLWVIGQGWAGDLNYESQADLELWMASYTKYILHYSQLAEELNIEMLSVGTEVRQIAKSHPSFWRNLISQVRSIYHGPVTYSANWDNYQNIKFWEELNYIGVDAYFPASESKTPEIAELVSENLKIREQLQKFSEAYLKKVLFTEFGFQSVDFCTSGHWKTDGINHKVNLQGQANAYRALFETYWNEDWFAGGFAWKWHYKHSKTGGQNDLKFSPQNKLAEKILKNQYSKNEKN
ncbi:MAG: hypothetical protein ABJF04_16405 [Reichenbachiella sp.]|uniref:glycoside hydrolase family 113 n=1 Tax=Reichenbachiella sp. TaxID=2184521 RepID=UPI003262E740